MNTSHLIEWADNALYNLKNIGADNLSYIDRIRLESGIEQIQSILAMLEINEEMRIKEGK